MAKIIPAVPGLPNPYDFFPADVVDNISAIAGKIFRVAIIVMQTRGRLGPAPVDGQNPVFRDKYRGDDGEIFQTPGVIKKSPKTVNGENQDAEFRKTIRETQQKGQPYKVSLTPTSPVFVDKIKIVDLDYQGNDNRFYDYIELPFIPRKLSKTPESKFMGIATIGRNLPFYHFTGAEDNLEFEIDWFSDTYHREDVIFNCRWLEALTKTDGYGVPHRVKIVWGKDDRLFRDEIWLLTSAAYELEQFNRGYKDPDSQEYISTSLLPVQARQTVHFKKVSKTNPKYVDIMGHVLGGNTHTGIRPNQLAIGSQPNFV